MKTHRFIALMIFASFVSCCWGQDKNTLEDGIKSYRNNNLEAALPQFQHAVKEKPNDADARAWLAETYRRLGKKEDAVKTAREALGINPCQSFAHTVIAEACNPQYGIWEQANSDTAWQHLQQAVHCNPDDGNALLDIWIEGIRREDEAQWKNALRGLMKSKFFTTATLSYNRWLLAHLPKDAVLFTNGDMDTYPTAALQLVEQFRTDVAIVNLSLLNTPWYAHFISKYYNVPLPFSDAAIDSLRYYQVSQNHFLSPSSQIVQGWFAQKEKNNFSRPIAISTTVDTNSLPDIRNRLKLAGAYWIWFPQNVDIPHDLQLMQKSFKSIDPKNFAGPFISSQDRSCIRIYYRNGPALNLISAMLHYSDLLIHGKHISEALQTINAAEKIDKSLDSGQQFAEEISDLREAAKR